MSEKLKTIIPKARVQETIDEIADRINRDYDGQPVHLIGVLRGAAYFLCNLSLRLTMPVTMDFVRVESYEGTDPGHLKNIMGLSESLKDKNVIIVEDIVDSGQTLNYLKALLITEDPKSLKICTLLDKPSRRTVELEPDYAGTEISDVFVVGFGLDYEQRYRNLPYVAELQFE